MGRLFLRRAGAYLTDLFLLFLVTFASSLAFVIAYAAVSGADAVRVANDPGTGAAVHAIYAIYFLSYFTISHWYAGATLGKKLFQLRVESASGQELGLGHAFARSVCYLLSSHLTFGLGFLLPLVRKDGKTLHDLVTRTRVRCRDASSVILLEDQSKAA